MDGSVIYKHCSERCMSLHFGKLSEVPFQADLVYLKVNRQLIDTIVLKITKVASTKMSGNTILSIQLCLSRNHPRIPNDTPYALVQIRTAVKTTLFFHLICRQGNPCGMPPFLKTWTQLITFEYLVLYKKLCSLRWLRMAFQICHHLQCELRIQMQDIVMKTL